MHKATHNCPFGLYLQRRILIAFVTSGPHNGATYEYPTYYFKSFSARPSPKANRERKKEPALPGARKIIAFRGKTVASFLGVKAGNIKEYTAGAIADKGRQLKIALENRCIFG